MKSKINICKNIANYRCFECEGSLIIENSEYICTTCGLVNDIAIRNDIYAFGRHFTNKLTNEKGYLGSKVEFANSRLNRANKYDNSRENTMRERLQIILNEACNLLHVSKNIEKEAFYLYCKILRERDDIPNNVSLICACLYDSVKNSRRDLGVNEIMEAFRESGHRIRYSLIYKHFKIYPEYFKNVNRQKPLEHHIFKFVLQIGDSKSFKRRFKGKNPSFSYERYVKNLAHVSKKIKDKVQIGGINRKAFCLSVIYTAHRMISVHFQLKRALTQNILGEIVRYKSYAIRDSYVRAGLKDLCKRFELKTRNERNGEIV